MAEVLVKVPEKAESEFKSRGINLKEFLRKAVEAKAFELELETSAEMRRAFLEAISSKSKLSEEEADKFALELGRKIKRGRFEKLKRMGVV